MKVNHDLVRLILLKCETVPPNREPGHVVVDGYDEDLVLEHIELLRDGGFLEANLLKDKTSSRRILTAHVVRLTYQGQEFLANAKNEAIWQRTTKVVTERGGSVALEILSSLLSKVAQSVFGLG